jgi:group I intron endonuclease
MIIYLAVNNINGKVYVGQTINSLKTRSWYHKRDAIIYNKRSHFYCAIRKYGIENFNFIIIDNAKSIDELNNKEKFWIRYYGSFNPKYGYNSTTGGDNKITRIETRNKLSKSMTGEKNPFYGRHHNPETKSLIGNIHRGKKLSPEHIKSLKIKNSRRLSAEHKLKIKEAIKGQKRTEKQNLNIKLSHYDCTGENNSQAILKSYQVVDIINMMKTGVSITSIANEYNVSKCCIKDIKNNRSWRNIPR